MNTMFTPSFFRRVIATALLGTWACSYAPVIAAADGTFTRTTVVHYADLNLSSPEGLASLYGRIVAAAHEVCSDFENNRNLRFRDSAKACIHKATASAVTRVGRADLIALYNTKNREPLPTIAAAPTR